MSFFGPTYLTQSDGYVKSDIMMMRRLEYLHSPLNLALYRYGCTNIVSFLAAGDKELLCVL